MEKKLKDYILQRRFLYRGTIDIRFEERQKSGPYYGRYDRADESLTKYQGFVTSTDIFPLNAIRNGTSRYKSDWYDGSGRFHGSEKTKAKPILLAIEAEPYIKVMRKGAEFNPLGILKKFKKTDSPLEMLFAFSKEIEILGPIDYSNIIQINSIEQFKGINPFLSEADIIFYNILKDLQS